MFAQEALTKPRSGQVSPCAHFPLDALLGGPHCTSGEDALRSGRGRDRNQLCCLLSPGRSAPGGEGWARRLSATEATWCGGPARATLSLGFTVGPSGGPEAHSELNLRPALWRPLWVHLQPLAKPEHKCSPRVSPCPCLDPHVKQQGPPEASTGGRGSQEWSQPFSQPILFPAWPSGLIQEAIFSAWQQVGDSV